MGFRRDSFATVWDINPRSDTMVSARISISRKDRQTGNYVQDFGGFVSFVGTACAAKASKLKQKDRIKLKDVDVTNKYDADKHVTYTNFNIYSFDLADEADSSSGNTATPEPSSPVDELSENLPF